jgi:hypothetical protein
LSLPWAADQQRRCGWLSQISISPPVSWIPASNKIFSCTLVSARQYHTAQQATDGFVAIAVCRILTGNHPFVDILAKLAVNAIK